jgi:type I restriction enzyme R subunit
MRRHYLSDDEEAQVRKAFCKPGESPEILIVTEKLLTGYDAPILYGMCLDKPMRDLSNTLIPPVLSGGGPGRG